MNNNVMNDTNTQENTQTLTVIKGDFAGADLLETFKDPAGSFYCSIKDDGKRATKVAIYNAISVSDEQLADHINEVLEIVNVVAHPVSLVDENTGEVITALRTVLIDKSGKAYNAVSGGIANAVSRIMAIVGTPEDGAWEKEPVKVKVKQVKTRNGVNKVNTLELI